jgi:hypothetical protein
VPVGSPFKAATHETTKATRAKMNIIFSAGLTTSFVKTSVIFSPRQDKLKIGEEIEFWENQNFTISSMVLRFFRCVMVDFFLPN